MVGVNKVNASVVEKMAILNKNGADRGDGSGRDEERNQDAKWIN